MKRILITGAAGFIGSKLMDCLMMAGHDVMGIDNYNNHLYDNKLKVDRVDHFGLRERLFHCDIYSEREKLGKLFDNFRPNIVIHLAALAGVRDSFGKENQYHRNNIEGTWNIIKLCQLFCVDRVLYASTSCAFGTCPDLPWVEPSKEKFNGGYQLNAYGYSKFVNECQFKMSGLNNVGMRFFTVYGPWGRPDMAVYSFTKDMLEEKPITLYNYGNMKRDFTFISDVIDGIKVILDNRNIESGEVFNIGSGKQVNLKDFATIIARTCEVKPRFIPKPKHPADTVETWSSIEKLGKYGYKPRVNIEQGIKNFYTWYNWYHNK